MYNRTDKRRIYQIIEMYLSNKIDETSFCDEFYCSYDLELDYDSLTKDEDKAFYELSEITSRFSEFEEDHQNLPDFFYTKEQVRKKIIETKEKLKDEFNKFEKELHEDQQENNE